MMSAPFFFRMRTARRTAQGPSTSMPKPSICGRAWSGCRSALLEVAPTSRPEATSRGPGMWPCSMPRLRCTSMRCTEPKLMAEVKPAPSISRALATECSMASSTGVLSNSVGPLLV